jgi:hypothetical protein
MANLASSYVQLEGFELGFNSAASRTCRRTTAVVLTNKYVYALLTQTANAFRACIAVAQYR